MCVWNLDRNIILSECVELRGKRCTLYELGYFGYFVLSILGVVFHESFFDQTDKDDEKETDCRPPCRLSILGVSFHESFLDQTDKDDEKETDWRSPCRISPAAGSGPAS